MRIARSSIAGVALSLLLTGCSTLGWFGSKNSSQPISDPLSNTGYPAPGTLTPSDQRFSDIPLPVGAKEDLQRSYVFESDVIQIGRMIYTVNASINEVAQFYIQRCPTQGWKLETVTQAEGAHMLFEKPDRRLTVTVTNPSKAKRGVLLTLHLTPKQDALGVAY